MRAGASFLSIDDLKNDCPVLFIALLPMSPGVPCVARSGESARTLPVMLSGDKRSYITRGRSVCVLFISLTECLSKSVAIIPMAKEYHWDNDMRGHIVGSHSTGRC